jgi:hypothetical protein
VALGATPKTTGLITSGFLSEKTSWKTRAFTVDKDFIEKTQQIWISEA